MINRILLALVLSLPSGLLAQVSFEHSSFGKSLQKAGQDGKVLFVYLYTDWCAPCKQLDTIVFSDPRIRDLLNGRFVCLKLNAEKGEGIKVNADYHVGGYPTFLFLDSTGKKLGQILGTLSNDRYLVAIRNNGHLDPATASPRVRSKSR
jgi:thiol:disulfide interchange protein